MMDVVDMCSECSRSLPAPFEPVIITMSLYGPPFFLVISQLDLEGKGRVVVIAGDKTQITRMNLWSFWDLAIFGKGPLFEWILPGGIPRQWEGMRAGGYTVTTDRSDGEFFNSTFSSYLFFLLILHPLYSYLSFLSLTSVF